MKDRMQSLKGFGNGGVLLNAVPLNSHRRVNTIDDIGQSVFPSTFPLLLRDLPWEESTPAMPREISN